MLYVREAQIADAEAIARAHVDTWRTAYQGLVPDEYLAWLSYEQREQFWRGHLEAQTEDHFI